LRPSADTNAHRHGLSEAERVADCKHDVADAKRIGIAESDRLNHSAFDPQDCDVGFRIGAHGLRFSFFPSPSATSISSAASTT